MTITLKLSKNTQEKMIKFFEDSKRDKTPAYAVFQANSEDTVVTLYESGKAVFQGVSADVDAAMWTQVEKKLNPNNKDIEQKKEEKKEKKDEKRVRHDANTIGSDEVGTGDFFGPIVVTSCYVSKDDVSFLEDLGIKDSKKLTDDKIIKLGPELIKRLKHETIVLSNADYNKHHSVNFNMNKIKAVLHNKVLILLSNKVDDYERVVVDQFTTPNSYYNYLKDAKFVFRNITFFTKAEDISLPVACASIISRYYFIKKMDEISNELDIVIPYGANEQVNAVALDIAKKYGIDKLGNYCKLNFKNFEKIKDNL